MPRCQACNHTSDELRRGRCLLCYGRWAERRPVGFGACCRFCTERRRDVLRSVEMLGRWTVVCFNCRGQIDSLEVVPQSFYEIRLALKRERRSTDRRSGKTDSRVYQRERRKSDRRQARLADNTLLIDDSMILDEDFDLPIDMSDVPAGEVTQIASLSEIRQREMARHFQREI